MKRSIIRLFGLFFVISFITFGSNSNLNPQALIDSTKIYIKKMPKARLSEGEKGTEQVQNQAQVEHVKSDTTTDKKLLWIELELKTQDDVDFLKNLGLTCCSELGICSCMVTVELLNKIKKQKIDFRIDRRKTLIEGLKLKRQSEPKEEKEQKPKGEESQIFTPLKTTAQTLNTDSINVWGYISYEGEEDPYPIESGTGWIDLHLTNIPSGCDYDLYLYDGYLNPVDSSIKSGNSDERINRYCQAGDYLILVVGYYGYSTTQPYHLYGSYPHAGMPDLIIQSLTVSNNSPFVNEYMGVHMAIKNIGNYPAYWFFNGFYYKLDTIPDCGTTENHYFFIYELLPESTYVYDYNVTSSDTATWRMYGLADCDCQVEESSEGNNYKGPVNVAWRTAPDLIIQSISPSTSTPTISEHFNATITVKNQGSGDVDNWFYTSVYYNRPSKPTLPDWGDMFYWLDSLGAGQTETFTFYKSRTSWTSGSTWHTWGVVDSWDSTWGRIRESN
jgi:hypothetical protein